MTSASKAGVPGLRASGHRNPTKEDRGAWARASRMALGAAIARATHCRYDDPLVFHDAYAFDMLYGAWRWIVGSRVLDRLVLRRLLGSMRPVYGEVVGRSRFSEDALHAAIARGVRQYVIVGAGLDTYALRAPRLHRLRIFELDQRASLERKRRQIRRIGAALSNVEYVATDLERESLADALRRSSFDPAAPCFVSWLGTTYYLNEAAVHATLRSIAALAARGSELVFDFCVPEASLGPVDRAELAALKRFAARRGEPFASSFLPADMARHVADAGMEPIEIVSAEQLEHRYFAGRADGLRPSRFACLAHLRF